MNESRIADIPQKQKIKSWDSSRRRSPTKWHNAFNKIIKSLTRDLKTLVESK
jgi:hypothetical protein